MSANLRRSSTAVVALALFVGCHRPPNPLPRETRVAIVEFAIADDAKIERYNAPYDSLGMHFAEHAAKRLRARSFNATAVPAGTPPDADLIVTGEITHIDGGSAAKRILVGWGAGHSTFAVMGEVRRADGTRVAVFSDERIGGGWGNEGAADNACQIVAFKLVDMLCTGEYRGGRPGSPGFIVRKPQTNGSERPVRSATERLRELDELKERGRVTDDEYREKRRRIIDEL
jgi:hypothetical protein